MTKATLYCAALLAGVLATPAHAEYLRTGPMIATVCTGFGIKVCGPKEVVAVEQGGKLYEPAESFASVDDHSSSGKCHIKTGSSDILSAAINAIKLPTFYTNEGGQRVKISPDYVTFKCTKR